MATWLDLLDRLEDGLYADARLHVEATYRGSPLPAWMAVALATVARSAHERAPVLVVNVKGRAVPDALVILRLADFEELAILAPDRAEP